MAAERNAKGPRNRPRARLVCDTCRSKKIKVLSLDVALYWLFTNNCLSVMPRRFPAVPSALHVEPHSPSVTLTRTPIEEG